MLVLKTTWLLLLHATNLTVKKTRERKHLKTWIAMMPIANPLRPCLHIMLVYKKLMLFSLSLYAILWLPSKCLILKAFGIIAEFFFFLALEGCSWQYLLEHLFRAYPGSQSHSPGKWFQAVLRSMGLPAKNSLKNLWHSIAGHSYVDDVVIVFVLVPSSYISASWSQTKIQPS